jgi:hypothetical protein
MIKNKKIYGIETSSSIEYPATIILFELGVIDGHIPITHMFTLTGEIVCDFIIKVLFEESE